jgi:hypothetical protein
MSTLNFFGTLELFQKITGRPSFAAFQVTLRRGEEFRQIHCPEVFFIYEGNHRVRRFPCYDQFLCLAYAQLTYRESLRDIETWQSKSPLTRHHREKGLLGRS